MAIADTLVHFISSVSFAGALMVLLLTFIVSYFVFSSQKDRKEPPGPRPLPLLGNLLQMDIDRLYYTLVKLSKTHGPVFTFYLGSKKVVVLAGYKTVKEALVNYAEEFGERGQIPILYDINKGNGITWSNGGSWKELRRFVLRNLKDFGMGKKVFGNSIAEECLYLIEEMKKFKGEAFDTTRPLTCAVSNLICSMVYGSRFEYDNPKFTSLVAQITRLNELLWSSSAQIYSLNQWVGKKLPVNKEIHQLSSNLTKGCLELISHLKKSLQPEMCRGIADAFMVRKQSLENSGITNSHFHNENLLMTIHQLFSAGTDTTATTLRWGLLLMAKYPKIQDQVREEMSRVIGSRQVQVEDRKNLPFTDAVIHEIQRFSNIVPMSLPRRMSQDTVFQSYLINKGTMVIPLLGSVLHDESEWENPHSFYPAHFLDNNGAFVKRDAFMPFSAGNRICLGENLAKMELFIFFTSLLQHFCFTPPPGVTEDELDLRPTFGLVLSPLRHKLCAVSLLSQGLENVKPHANEQ